MILEIKKFEVSDLYQISFLLGKHLYFVLLYFESVYNPDPLPSPSMPTEPRAGEACDSATPDPDAI